MCWKHIPHGSFIASLHGLLNVPSQHWWALLGFVLVCMFWQGDMQRYFSHSKAAFGRRVTPSPSASACFTVRTVQSCLGRDQREHRVLSGRHPRPPRMCGKAVCARPCTFPASWRRAPHLACSVGSPGTVILWLTALPRGLKALCSFHHLQACCSDVRSFFLAFLPSSCATACWWSCSVMDGMLHLSHYWH